MNESLARASVIRYLLKHDTGGKTASDKHSELESYIPALVDFYNNAAKESESLFEIKAEPTRTHC